MKGKILACFGLLLCAVAMTSCGEREKQTASAPEGFTADIILKTTPVKDQGKSDFGWAFAMLATIETEHLAQGDSVNLSADYTARCFLEEQARRYFDSGGRTAISQKGDGLALIRLIRKRGALPYDSYHPRRPVNYNTLATKLAAIIDLQLSRRASWQQCEKAVQAQLDKEIGYLPQMVFMLGAEYTPLEFAHSVCGAQEYTAVNADEKPLASLIKHSVEQRHPVFWQSKTDGHALAIIGIGHDAKDNEYFIAKDSHGTSNPAQGLRYLPLENLEKQTARIILQTDLLRNENP